MKTAKIVFTLLLINVVFAMPRGVVAQDVLTLSIEEGSGVNALWHFSFAHSPTATLSISQFKLWIDTTQNGFPDVRFAGNNTVELPASTKDWSTGTDNNLDSAFWCADQSGFILRGTKDSFFAFQLQTNLNNPNANIFGYPITINWIANWATENSHLDPCANVTGVSSGSFVVEDFPWTGNYLDTVTGTSSTPGCDPLFNFTVYNKNSTQIPIDGLVFFTNEFSGTMRPSEVQLPSPWMLDSVTQAAVYCHAPNGSGISYHQSLGGFIIGLRADPSATFFSFPWEALSGGTIIDEDTVWNVPATVPQCSTNPSSDTVFISSSGKCSFNANLENFHSGSGGDTVSRLSTFIISTPTAGVTFSSAILPPKIEYPWIVGWADSGVGTNKITFYVYKNPSEYGQPGGITAPWGFSLDNGAADTPSVIINWQTLDSGRVITGGTQTIKCVPRGAPDQAVISGMSGCEYRLIITNTHTPKSGTQGVGVQMPSDTGAFLSAKGTFSAPAGWTPSFGNGILFQNLAHPLQPLVSDTFFFTISPTKAGATWPLTILTFQSGSDAQMTDTVINVPGCTPAVVCDSVSAKVDTATCTATLMVLNRRSSNATVDSVVVKPTGGWHIGTASANIPWSKKVDANNDSVVFTGSLASELSQPFSVSFNYGPNTSSFTVEVNTYASGAVCSNTFTMTCLSAGVSVPAFSQAASLALTVVPNPLNNRSDISFTLGSFSDVNLMLVDILGRTQATLFGGTLPSGEHTLPLDASRLAPGTYYLRLEAEGQRVTTKIVVGR